MIKGDPGIDSYVGSLGGAFIDGDLLADPAKLSDYFVP